MKQTRLTSLQLDVPLEDNQFYYDLSWCNSPDEADRVRRCFLSLEEEVKDERMLEGHCECIEFKDGRKYAFVSSYGRKEWGPWIIRGHEETHALKFFDKIELLYTELEKRFGIEIPSPEPNEEVLANLGGLYSLLIRGQYINTNDLKSSDNQNMIDADTIVRKFLSFSKK